MARTSQVILQENLFYTIKAKNGKVLEVEDFNTDNGAHIRLWDDDGHPWQQWQFVEAGERRYRIKNRFTGKYIDLMYGGVEDGTWLHQWSYTSGLSQCWELVSEKNGRIRIRSVLADKYIDLVAMNTANGAQAQIWLDIPGGNQEWNLARVDDKPVDEEAVREAVQKKATASQRKHTNDTVKQISGKGKARSKK